MSVSYPSTQAFANTEQYQFIKKLVSICTLSFYFHCLINSRDFFQLLVIHLSPVIETELTLLNLLVLSVGSLGFSIYK